MTQDDDDLPSATSIEALLTVGVGLCLYLQANVRSEESRKLAFDQADDFVADALARYGKDLGLT